MLWLLVLKPHSTIFSCFVGDYHQPQVTDKLYYIMLYRVQPVPVRYHTRGKGVLPLLSLSMRDNDRRGMHVPWLSQWWLKSVLFSNSYIFVCYFIHHCRSFSCSFSFGHCIVCPSIYGCWSPLWYLLAIVLSVLPITAADHPFSIILISYPTTSHSLCYIYQRDMILVLQQMYE